MNTSLTIRGSKALHAIMNLVFGGSAPTRPVNASQVRRAYPQPGESIRGPEPCDDAMSNLSLEHEDHELDDPAEAMSRLSLSREEPGANDPDSSMSWLSLSWEAPEHRERTR